MLMTNADSGIGITFLSQYSLADTYYRLRRYGSSGSFHFDPHGTNVWGDTDTGVIPAENLWYQFRIQVEVGDSVTQMRCRVWPDGESEPVDWQADAYDDSASRLTEGFIGLWSSNGGSKYWDDLSVIPVMSTVPAVSSAATTV